MSWNRKNAGKRNTLHSKNVSLSFYPYWATGKVINGDVMSLSGVGDEEEVGRVCKVVI